MTSPLRLGPEDRLLVACSRLELGHEERAALAALVQGRLRWAEVVRRARWQRVHGLVHHHLRAQGLEGAVPEVVARGLRRLYLGDAARGLALAQELRRVLRALGDAGVPTVVLKGAYLAHAVYPHPALRPMADLDLLVPRERLEAAEGVALALGYRPQGSPEEQRRTRQGHRHLPTLAHPERRTLLEVHWHLVRPDSPLHFPLGGLWARVRPARVAGTEALALAPADLLLHLCLNFFLDRRYRTYAALGQLCDIAVVAGPSGAALDWDLLQREALAHRLAGPVHCALHAAAALLGAPVPGEALARLRPPVFEPALALAFLRRRVLACDGFAAHQVVAPDAPYTAGGFLRGALGRLLPAPEALARRYGAPAGASPLALYARRLGEAAAVLGRWALRPWALGEEVRLDRWLHALHGAAAVDRPGVVGAAAPVSTRHR